MRDSEIYRLLGQKEEKIKLLTNYVDDFTKEQSMHMNSLIMTFNAFKNVIISKELITNDELNEMVMVEVKKLKERNIENANSEEEKPKKKKKIKNDE